MITETPSMGNNEFLENTANQTNLRSTCYTPSDLEFRHFMAGLNSVSSFLGSIGNASVCLTVFRTPRLHKISGWLIFNLAIADLIVTTFSQPTFAFLLAREYGVLTCASWLVYLALASNVIGHYSCGASLANMVALSVDCCVAILNPLKHAAMAPFLLKLALCSIWVAGCIPAAFLFTDFDADFQALIFTILLSGSYIVVLICYVLIVIKVKKQEKVRKQLQVGHTSMTTSSGERRLAKTVAIVIGVFTLSWAPFGYQLLSKPGITNGSQYFWSTTFGLCNSAVNPFVYFFRDKNYRQALAQAVRLFSSRSCVTPRGVILPSTEARAELCHTTRFSQSPSLSARQS